MEGKNYFLLILFSLLGIIIFIPFEAICQNTISIHQGIENSGFYNLTSDEDYEISKNSALSSRTTFSFSLPRSKDRRIAFQLYYASNIKITQQVDLFKGHYFYVDSIEYNFQRIGVSVVLEKKINESNNFDVFFFISPSVSYIISTQTNGFQTSPTTVKQTDSLGQQRTVMTNRTTIVNDDSNIHKLLIGASFGLRIQKSISESFAISLNNAISVGISNLPKTRPYSSLRSISCQVGLVYLLKK